MAGEFDGKVALVTGGGAGIGRAACVAFAARGARVAVADVDIDGANETVKLIQQDGGKALPVEVDVSKAADVQMMVARVVEAYGRLDYAYNNAGIEGAGVLTHEYSEEVWDRTIEVDLKSVWLCMKYEIPQMLKQGGGAIVNTSSIYGLVGGETTAAYTAAKHGVIGLTKTAGVEYTKRGIRVNAVCPGAINTPMMERLLARDPDGEAKESVERSPVGRMAEPEEVAEAVVWLCSDAASFVTGHAMAVDGGLAAI